jgi:hypothetical protein
MKMLDDWRRVRQQADERRARERAAWRETIRKPQWCERLKGRYDAAYYWNGHTAAEDCPPWPLYVYEVETGKLIDTVYLYADHHSASGIAKLRKEAEEIVEQYERWAAVPEDQQPLRPIEDMDEVP